MRYPIIALLCAFAVTFIACGEDEQSSEVIDRTATTQASIQGHWDVSTAYRNKRITETLTEGYFEFAADNKMVFNLTGNPEHTTYTVIDTLIQVREGSMDFDASVDKVEDSTMVLSMELSNTPFTIIFKQADSMIADRVEETEDVE